MKDCGLGGGGCLGGLKKRMFIESQDLTFDGNEIEKTKTKSV